MAAVEVEMHPVKSGPVRKLKDGFVTSSAVPHRPCRLYYQLHTNTKADVEASTRVILTHGLGCDLKAWEFQLEELLADQHVGLHLCVFDNRGIGKSGSPTNKQDYTTDIMARDVLHLMDHLGWQTAHLVGFSMGAMVSTRLALAAPERVLSLSLLAISGGGVRSLPRTWRGWKYAIRGASAKTPQQKAWVDVKFHFSKATLRQRVPTKHCSIQDLLLAEYQQNHSKPEAGAGAHGMKGQMHACWHHRLDKEDEAALYSLGVPVLLLHGRHDLIATAAYAESLAHRLGATCVLLDAAHFIPRECRREVNKLLLEMFRTARPTPLFSHPSSRDFR